MSHNIRNLIKLLNQNKKFLFYSDSGLNDFFSGISFNIDYIWMNGLKLNNLHVYSSVYSGLDEYLDFKTIQYCPLPTLNDYDFISEINAGGSTNRNPNTPRHISNFISLKEKYLVNTDRIKKEIAVHIRCYKSEQSIISREEEIEGYLKSFFKIYSPNENYAIFSDTDCGEIFFSRIDPQNYAKIRFIVPEDNINVNDWGQKFFFRNKYTLLSLRSLYEMSFAKQIYKTAGSFTNACCVFNPACKITQLI